jgi:hypothetical protein
MAGGTIKEGERMESPGREVLNNDRVVVKPTKPEESPKPKTPYELVAGQDPERRRALREHGING